jgi:hypothetical protein
MAFPVVATAEAYASTDALRETWDLAAGENTEVAVGTALINNDRPGVAYTPSGGHTISKTVGGLTVSGFGDGGAGLDALEVSVATDGGYEFPVTGVTDATVNGVKVYAVVASGKITELTLTASTNKLFGVVNNPKGYVPSATACCVKIGAGL